MEKPDSKYCLEISVSQIEKAEPIRPSRWRDRVHNFSWQWHVIVMATGVCSSLLHNFPYHDGPGGSVLKIMALSLFLFDLVIFVLLCSWTVARCIMFPEDWSTILTDPAKSLFIGFFANGAAALINAGLSVNRDWGTGSTAFLYTLWGFWWLDCIVSCSIAFGLVYIMMGQNTREMSKVGPVWMVPIITLITISSSGGLFARAFLPYSHTLALLSSALSVTMLLIGLSFTMMFTTVFLLRLYLYGPLEGTAVLTTFTTLTPLGQGGYSMLINGQDLSELLPDEIQETLAPATAGAAAPLVGKFIFSVCFCAAYALWCMGVAWITLSCFSIIRRAHTLHKLPFCISHWCVIVPNGVFASLSLQMATVLDSPFFRAFGAVWSCLVFILWTVIFLRSIPALIDGSIFNKPSPSATTTVTTSSSTASSAPMVTIDAPRSPIKVVLGRGESFSSEKSQDIESVVATLCYKKAQTAIEENSASEHNDGSHSM